MADDTTRKRGTRRPPVGIEKRTRLRIRGKAWTHARGQTLAGELTALPACEMRGRYEATFDAVTCPYCLEIIRKRIDYIELESRRARE